MKDRRGQALLEFALVTFVAGLLVLSLAAALLGLFAGPQPQNQAHGFKFGKLVKGFH